MQPSSSDRGQRHVCGQCQAKFYDLNRPHPLCPRCGADPAVAPAAPRKKPSARPAAPKVAKAPEPRAEEADELEGVDDDPDEDEDEVDDDGD